MDVKISSIYNRKKIHLNPMTGGAVTNALVDSGAMVHCCPIELAELKPHRRRHTDKGTKLHDVQGNEIKTEGMFDLLCWLKTTKGHKFAIVLQAFVASVPQVVIFAGKLKKGGANVVSDKEEVQGVFLVTDHPVTGVEFSHDRNVFFLNKEIPDLVNVSQVPRVHLVAPVHDDEGMTHMQSFYQYAERNSCRWSAPF